MKHCKNAFLLLSLMLVTLCFGQQHPSHADELLAIAQKLDWLDRSVAEQEKNIQIASGEDQKNEQFQELKALKEKRSQFQDRFLSIAAEINLDETRGSGDGDKKRNVVEELQALLLPALDSLQRMSARPRLIEALRRKIDLIEGKMGALEDGRVRLEQFMRQQKTSGPLLKRRLEEALEDLNSRVNDLRIHYNDLNRQLQMELGKDKTLMEAIEELMRNFFGRRGRNLLWAFFVFGGVWWGMWRRKRLQSLPRYVERKGGQFLFKPFRLLYPFIVFCCAFTATLLCLYFLNDWLLVTVMSLILLSLFWSLKQVLPKFIEEGKLILNFGPVKEGERLVYNGLPWRIESLGLVALLKNPLLEGGVLRLPAKELLKLSSRSIVEGEKWFPSAKNDFVLLADGFYGEVVVQTTEQVIVKSVRGVWRYYSTLSYIALNPQNYSEGFNIETFWSLCHEDREKLPQILQSLTSELKMAMQQRHPNLRYTDLIVGLSHVDLWAIHIAVYLYCPGEMASAYPSLPRLLQNLCLEISQKWGLQLPSSPLLTR